MTIRIQLTAGERPDPIAHTFLEADSGDVIDLSGWAVTATWVHVETGATGTITGTVDGPAGTALVTLSDASMATPGVVELTVWAGNGTLRYASPVYRLCIADPPGTAPAI